MELNDSTRNDLIGLEYLCDSKFRVNLQKYMCGNVFGYLQEKMREI